MFAVIAHQLRRHPFHFSAIEHIQKQGLQNIVAVVACGDFGRAQFSRRTIQDTPTQTRAQRAGGFSFRNLLFHNAVGVFFDDFIFYAQLLKVGWQDMFRETRLLLIEVDGDQ